MRLDRRATIKLYTGHRSDFGEWVRELASSHTVWLGLDTGPTPRHGQTGTRRELEPEGARTENVSEFIVRWFEALASADLANDHIVEMNGQTWKIVEREEDLGSESRGPARRRWLRLTCVEQRS